MICLKNPFEEINNFSNMLLNSEYIIAAKNEIFTDSEKKIILVVAHNLTNSLLKH